jgi:signal transduction histidine kinase/ActR/RegA family two-component response regulator
MSSPSAAELRVLVCAPIGRDSALTTELLKRDGIACYPCRSMGDLCDRLAEGAGAVLITEEALLDEAVDAFAALLEAQPAWSDISVLLFAGGHRSEASLRTLRKLEVLRNVTMLDRPLRTEAVISTVRAALRGRQRQYELRDVLIALHRARADAEHASRLKDEFLATVSHELRTPLNAIMGWVSMLRQARFEPERIAKVLEIVERNAKAQAQLIADILDISRMITGRVKLNLAPVSLARPVLDALDTVKPGAYSRGIEIRTDIDEGAVVHGDGERLQQVFWNVLSNACKFTPAGGRIDVMLSDDGHVASLTVTDTGSGIAPEFLPYVFDRFRQADQTFTRAHGGLGLGLAIVKHLVEMHGGDVRAHSDGPGKGSMFEIRLPVATRTHVRRRVHDAAPAADDAMPNVDLTGRFVLLVDDDEATRELMATILTQFGARVTAVDGARAALSQIDIEVPSLVIADIGMPGEDGLSMMRRIRGQHVKKSATVPAIALSAYARAEDRQAALEAGFDDFLTKPAMPADILRAVDRALSGVSRAR